MKDPFLLASPGEVNWVCVRWAEEATQECGGPCSWGNSCAGGLCRVRTQGLGSGSVEGCVWKWQLGSTVWD